ncbi:MAG: deoxyribodipyrimidine photo-lyase [Acidimicrobiia bacterium]|nr:deoxyribodipyrimidine photo-lyase [Acidimicrobiia bacterium]
MSAVMWFRRDLRLDDNPAWSAATSEHGEVTALFIVDQRLLDAAGDLRRNLLIANLNALDADLKERGGRLRIEAGEASSVLANHGGTVYWNADYSPYAIARDGRVRKQVERHEVFHGNFIHYPGHVLKDDGDPYRVFTPYYRRWIETDWPKVSMAEGTADIAGETGQGIPSGADPIIEPGTAGARKRLETFTDVVDQYPDYRNDPGRDDTSHLSADLKFGTISPRTIWDHLGTGSEGRRSFLRQLCWRDFYAQVLYYFPHSAKASLKPGYDDIGWLNDPVDIEAWKTGQTGYPFVDAAMRQLVATGWMHNRTRMVTASFLVKHLLVDWRIGERFFMENLIDGDPAQNIGNWQWVAGTGTDAAPYFRVFNPISQSKKFDPKGVYIRRFVPEVAALDDRDIHAPWDAPPLALAEAGIELGQTYPTPLIDHAFARERVLTAYKTALS